MTKKNEIIPCPSCQSPMKHPQRTFLPRDKIFNCSCGYRLAVSETEYEAMTGACFICGKDNCCASDHRFKGELIGFGF